MTFRRSFSTNSDIEVVVSRINFSTYSRSTYAMKEFGLRISGVKVVKEPSSCTYTLRPGSIAKRRAADPKVERQASEVHSPSQACYLL